MKHLAITVRGRVQGVSYRAFTAEKAKALGLRGWVRNQADGSVFLEAEGEAEQLEVLLDYLRQGPPGARIDELHSEVGALKNYSSFTIQR